VRLAAILRVILLCERVSLYLRARELLPELLLGDNSPLTLELIQFLLGILRRPSCCDQEHYGQWENDTNKHEDLL
jgi:hypothetical protein